MDRLLTLKTLAAATETSEAFWRKVASRRLIRTIKVGRALRVREADAIRFLAERERSAGGLPHDPITRVLDGAHAARDLTVTGR